VKPRIRVACRVAGMMRGGESGGEYEGEFDKLANRACSQIGRGGRQFIPMDAHNLRARAQQCWELLRFAVKPEVKEQLREWAEDFEAEAAAKERKER
jgi:hypothetical protein